MSNKSFVFVCMLKCVGVTTPNKGFELNEKCGIFLNVYSVIDNSFGFFVLAGSTAHAKWNNLDSCLTTTRMFGCVMLSGRVTREYTATRKTSAKWANEARSVEKEGSWTQQYIIQELLSSQSGGLCVKLTVCRCLCI